MAVNDVGYVSIGKETMQTMCNSAFRAGVGLEAFAKGLAGIVWAPVSGLARTAQHTYAIIPSAVKTPVDGATSFACTKMCALPHYLITLKDATVATRPVQYLLETAAAKKCADVKQYLTSKCSATSVSLQERLAAWKPNWMLGQLHIKAREQHAGYPLRQEVKNHQVSWSTSFAAYTPPICGEAPSTTAKLNPAGRTGLAGRGDLPNFGPNLLAEPLILRRHPETSQLEMLLVCKEGQWVLPSGMEKAGETVSQTFARVAKEETGVEISFNHGELLFAGYVDDSSNTDHAWVETGVIQRVLTADEAEHIASPQSGKAAWVSVTPHLLKHTPYEKVVQNSLASLSQVKLSTHYARAL